MSAPTVDPWGSDLPGVSVRDIAKAPLSEPVNEADGAEAWMDCLVAVGDLSEAARALDRHLGTAVPYQSHRLGGEHLIALVAQVQDVRRALAQTEAIVARAVGMDEQVSKAGRLPDGRAYEVRKGATRKQWDHPAWRQAVREQVLSGVGEVVDTATGETVDLPALVAAAQEAQGAGAPKATALRQLGLEVDAFCESSPNPWSVTVTGLTGEAGAA